MADTTTIFENNARKWTSATQVAQAASEASQDARTLVQAAYDAAQGNGATARDAADLAAIEAAAGKRMNEQQGGLTVPTVPAP